MSPFTSLDQELLPSRYTKLVVENITLTLVFSLSSGLWCGHDGEPTNIQADVGLVLT